MGILHRIQALSCDNIQILMSCFELYYTGDVSPKTSSKFTPGFGNIKHINLIKLQCGNDVCNYSHVHISPVVYLSDSEQFKFKNIDFR